MTSDQLDEIVAMLREQHADAVASEGDYYADQFSFHGGGEAADAIQWLRSELVCLRIAIARLADQDATLSVRNGTVTVTMDATLTDDERYALQLAVMTVQSWWGLEDKATVALRGLLERLGGANG